MLREPDSWLQAAANDWKHPVTRDWELLKHTFDLLHNVNSKNKPKPYPTPWKTEGVKKIGGATKQTNTDVLRGLDRMNPKDDNGN